MLQSSSTRCKGKETNIRPLPLSLDGSVGGSYVCGVKVDEMAELAMKAYDCVAGRDGVRRRTSLQHDYVDILALFKAHCCKDYFLLLWIFLY